MTLLDACVENIKRSSEMGNVNDVNRLRTKIYSTALGALDKIYHQFREIKRLEGGDGFDFLDDCLPKVRELNEKVQIFTGVVLMYSLQSDWYKEVLNYTVGNY